jgi:hypothetical protein
MQALLRNLRFGACVLGQESSIHVRHGHHSLAEGIGANTAIFPVSNALSSALRRRPFFFHNPEQLVRVIAEDETEDETKDRGSNYSVPSWCAMRTSLSNRWRFGRTTT